MRNARMVMGGLILLLACSLPSFAQSPSPAANSTGQDNAGFYRGWTLGTSFEGSTSGDGSVYDLGTSAGYNFTHHFGVDLGVPYVFVGTPSAVKTKNPGAVSGNVMGNIGADLKWLFPGNTMNYGSTIHLGAPTGDIKKGFSTGHATWNWSNHIEHGWGNFTPFIDAGVGNTVPDTRYIKKPFMTFGYNLAFEAGTPDDAGPGRLFSFAHPPPPLGPPTGISKGVRFTSGATRPSPGKNTKYKKYPNSNT